MTDSVELGVSVVICVDNVRMEDVSDAVLSGSVVVSFKAVVVVSAAGVLETELVLSTLVVVAVCSF